MKRNILPFLLSVIMTLFVTKSCVSQGSTLTGNLVNGMVLFTNQEGNEILDTLYSRTADARLYRLGEIEYQFLYDKYVAEQTKNQVLTGIISKQDIALEDRDRTIRKLSGQKFGIKAKGTVEKVLYLIAAFTGGYIIGKNVR